MNLCYFKQVATNGNQVVMISCYYPGRLSSSAILFTFSIIHLTTKDGGGRGPNIESSV